MTPRAGEPFVRTADIRGAVKGREVEILDALSVGWRGRNGQQHIRCPYKDHPDEHPSWRWDERKGRAYCSCITDGSHSIFDVMMKIENIGFESAKLRAAELLKGADLICERHPKRQKRGVSIPPQQHCNSATDADCTLASYAKAKRLPIEFLRGAGLTDSKWRGVPAVRMPYFDVAGAEVAVRYRIAVSGDDKFRWRKGNKPCLYGLNRIEAVRAGRAVTIVEGESDCHTLWHVGFPALGLPGAGTWREDRDAPTFDGIDPIYVAIEPDRGGESVMQWLARSKIRERARLVRLGQFKDASALFCDDPARFAERWRAALSAAVPWRQATAHTAGKTRAAAWSRCEALARQPKILHRLAEDLAASGVVGEHRPAKLIYLAGTSRLLERPVSIAVKGPSAGGKSFLVERTLQFFPPSAYYALSAMSERALAYSEEPLTHRMLVIYEAVGLKSDFASYLVRSLLSEGRVRYETVEKTKDGLRPRLIEREGPTGLIVTTTAVRLHPENETRLLSITVTDTKEQTHAILLEQAAQRSRNVAKLEDWHALQHWIAAGPAEVEIPFAETLAKMVPAVAVRLRRDFPTVLSLIRAHALLHQATRERAADGSIVATLDDYAVVRELVAPLVAEGVEATVSKRVRETVEAVTALAGEDGVSVSALARKLKLDKGSVSRRVKEAVDRGYVRNLEERQGRPARLVVGDPMPQETEILPARKCLEEGRCSVAMLRGGINNDPLSDDKDARSEKSAAAESYIPAGEEAAI
jgi:hypothetical protein